MTVTLKTLSLACFCSLGLTLTACSSSNSSDPAPEKGSQLSPTADLVPTTGDSAIGTVFTAGDTNLTVYTLTSGQPRELACDENCEAVWPPVITDVTQAGISGQFDIVTRADGKNQWMLNDYPLYFYSGDAAAGDVNGEAIGDVWFVARPIPVDSGDNNGEEISVVSGTTLDASGARVDKDGFTLYFFATDTDGVSNCNDGCATVWPPLFADKGARNQDRYSLITRDDGKLQWAYDGKSLYLYDGDNAAGDTLGDGVNGTWSIATP